MTMFRRTPTVDPRDRELAELRELLRQERAEVRRLTDAILTMRREGFEPPPAPAPPSAPAEEPLDPAVWAAIRAVTDAGSVEEADAITLARRLLERQQDAATVAAAIIRGGSLPAA